MFRRTVLRIPTPYILSRVELASFPFYVDSRVLIPRSFLAGFLTESIGDWLEGSPQSILDMCTGSGCLAIIAASIFPEAIVHAADVSQSALCVAQRNVRDYGLEDRLSLFHSDLFESLPPGQTYDLIICNPPYVPTDAYNALPREYTHEPSLALVAGSDGLDCVDRLIKDAAFFLKERGLLVIEVGYYRKMVDHRYPGLVKVWLGSETENDMFFLLTKEELLSYWAH